MGGREVVEAGAPREGISAVLDVVVAEHGVAAIAQPLQELAQDSLASRMRDEIPADADQVRVALHSPLHGGLDRAPPPRRESEVEVREVGDPQPLELAG